ncbi:MAG: hypothetical protein IJ068_03095 [Bacilli bacterium]|nr:hypothetical protein [Bacilli bacterium]
MSKKKELKQYKLMNDSVARILLKNSPVALELTARIVAEILKVDYKDVLNNMKLISEDMLFSVHTVDGRSDEVIETDKYYINIEICYTRGSNRQKQMDSYVFELFLGQVRRTEEYKNMKNIIQIMIENYDYFGKGKFSYEVGFMEKSLHIPEDDIITKYHISLDNLRNIDYNSIKYEKDALKKLLYIFVCEENNLEKAYRGDKFMEKVVKTAKEIAIDKKIPFYLSEEEIRRLDREEAVEEGYANGYESGKNDGIEQNRREMVINFYKNGATFELISKSSGLSVDEIKKIIKDNKDA